MSGVAREPVPSVFGTDWFIPNPADQLPELMRHARQWN
jgi:hypothetical protein